MKFVAIIVSLFPSFFIQASVEDDAEQLVMTEHDEGVIQTLVPVDFSERSVLPRDCLFGINDNRELSCLCNICRADLANPDYSVKLCNIDFFRYGERPNCCQGLLFDSDESATIYYCGKGLLCSFTNKCESAQVCPYGLALSWQKHCIDCDVGPKGTIWSCQDDTQKCSILWGLFSWLLCQSPKSYCKILGVKCYSKEEQNMQMPQIAEQQYGACGLCCTCRSSAKDNKIERSECENPCCCFVSRAPNITCGWGPFRCIGL